jgi:Skp family chaperone for outer membrane proteins
LALRNKSTGTLKLYEVNPITVGAEVTPQASKNLLLLQAELEVKDKSNDTTTTAKEQVAAAKKHLVQEFGQKRGKRIYEQADRMQVEAENLKAKLSKAAESVADSSIVLPNQDKLLTAQLTPPCNR